MEVCSHNKLDPETVLLKINGTNCNLNCIYCSEIKKRFNGRMAIDMCEDLFRNLPESSDIILHGGEPLLDPTYITAVIRKFREIRPGKILSIQTNGVITDEMKEVLLNNIDILKIGISIDGDFENNKYRIDRKKETVFDRVDGTISYFEKHGVDIKCITTINATNAEHPIDVLNYLLRHGNIKQIRFNPCFDMTDNKLTDYAVAPLKFLDFLKRVLNYWLENRVYRDVRVDPIQSEIEALLLLTVKPYLNCGKFISIYPDGEFTLCDALGIEKFHVSETSEIFAKAEEHVQFSCKRPCNSCEKYALCGGGCVAAFNRFQNNQRLIDEYCEYRIGLKQYIKSLIPNV